MAFQPGHKLAKGNKGARLIEEAIRRAIAQEDGKRIREGVEKLLDKVAEGDLAAFNILADRLDGKPNQSITTDLNVHRDRRELSDDELHAIASRGRTPAKESGKTQSDSIH
jgi:hypothetical protein